MTRAKHKLEHEYGGQKEKMEGSCGMGRKMQSGSKHRTRERTCKRRWRRWAPNVDRRARALKHQEDEKHEHHELASTWAHRHANTNTKKTSTWRRGDEEVWAKEDSASTFWHNYIFVLINLEPNMILPEVVFWASELRFTNHKILHTPCLEH